MKIIKIVLVLAALIFLAGLWWILYGYQEKPYPEGPTEMGGRLPKIYPDYTQTVIPPNIAPMNFNIEEEGEYFITTVSVGTSSMYVIRGREVRFPLQFWRRLLMSGMEGELTINIQVWRNGKWIQYDTIVNEIGCSPIDPWVSYRLIEPGYESYNHMTLNQRNLETFDEYTFVDNRRESNKVCVNCHSFQNYSTDRWLFHSRKYANGTVFVDHGKYKKTDMKPEGMFAQASYASWHPTENLVAFSVNDTFQMFHSRNPDRIEVMDEQSDLVLFNVDTEEMIPILVTPDVLETFPTWSPEGTSLYYCACHLDFKSKWTPPKENEEGHSEIDTIKDEALMSTGDDPDKSSPRRKEIRSRYRSIKYDLMRMSYDLETKKFGPPEKVLDSARLRKSIVHPRISPDGMSLVYAAINYGTFSIWHDESDLYLYDLFSEENRELTEINSEQSESYHSWDSSSRWMVFCSRRDDGTFTRLYFVWFDEDGVASKPFLLPQEDPDSNKARNLSYNIPEFTRERIRESTSQLTRWAGSKKIQPSRIRSVESGSVTPTNP